MGTSQSIGGNLSRWGEWYEGLVDVVIVSVARI